LLIAIASALPASDVVPVQEINGGLCARMSYEVTIEINGRIVTGSYTVAGNILTVSTGVGWKTAQLSWAGAWDAERIAKTLLRQLVDEGKA
jgi:hypothetical protein